MATGDVMDGVRAFVSRTKDRTVAETRFLFEKRDVHIALKIFGGLLIIIGLPLAIGGAYLLTLGGSWYYLVAGLGLAVSGLYVFRGLMTGVWIYLAVLLLTLLWAVVEVGLAFWPLVPRLVAPLFLGGVALLLTPLFAPSARRPARTRAFTVAGAALMIGFVGYLALMMQPHGVISNVIPFVPGQVTATTTAAGNNWYSYGRTGEGTRYAPFNQINLENVSELEVAWTARTGFIADQSRHLQDQNTPLYVDGTLYQCASGSQVTALDGVTGTIRWQFDPQAAANSPFWKRCRTLGYFDPGPQDSCGPRIVLTTVDGRMIALRASNGQMCETFGEAGTVDLSVGMGQMVPADPPNAGNIVAPMPGFLVQTTGPFVAGDRIVLGAWVADNVSVGEPSGAVRAFDALTGRQVWAWDLGNPAITNLPPEGETYTLGTPNVWSAMAFDLDLNMIYLPLGNATPDYYGGQRREFDDAYNSSVVALNLDTGREVWHFNTVHHDIWDYDVPSQPNLAEIPDGAGGTIPVVIQTTKRGQVFVLDRRTGVPVRTVEERAVPRGDGTVQGEYYSATQPYSTGMASISADPLSEQQMWGATPLDQMMCRILFRQYRYEGDFTAQSVHTSIVYPG
ncbi:MAG TPA: PQQ-binding-like beta-propeller repeat protein, partial [Brevundimonas sp.]|uniref:outer membrane protein assembly factor BamB family protein n=1 Tax=Brevundimonas sp. TaxID=1871086 RepID=UPI002C8AB176